MRSHRRSPNYARDISLRWIPTVYPALLIDSVYDSRENQPPTQGHDYNFDVRFGGNDAGLLSAQAKDLVGSAPHVILSQSNQALASLLKETHDIPIVGTVIGDPVGSGFIKSLTTAIALGARLVRPCSDSLNESCTRKSGADRLVIGERVAWVSA